MKWLNNLPIGAKVGVLVAIALLGLCAAGLEAARLMSSEILQSRIDQTHAIVDIARSLATGLQAQVDAGQLTKEAAIQEFSKRAQSLKYDNGSGYVFAYTMDGLTISSPDPNRSEPIGWTCRPTAAR